MQPLHDLRRRRHLALEIITHARIRQPERAIPQPFAPVAGIDYREPPPLEPAAAYGGGHQFELHPRRQGGPELAQDSRGKHARIGPDEIREALDTSPPGTLRWAFSFSDYQRIFQGLALGLEERGLIRNGHVPLPKDSEEVRGMWEWMHRHAGGNRLVFLADGVYSAEWDSRQREKVRQDVLRRIREKKDVDMVLAFGTWAGQDLAAQDLPVPVIVSSVTNAVDAGIIPSVEDSGRDNLVAPIEPDRFKRQVLLFHDIFAFKKLGIAYEDTPAGRSSIALNEIEDAARELGVTLLRCTDTFDIQDTDLASERLLACHKKLVEQGAEAVYLTYNVGLQASAMRNVLQPLADAHIPTFSQLGVPDVVHGALLSVAQSNAAEEGRFSAGLVEAILKGARPRDLSPVFESPVSMALNLFMATLIGWNPPLEVLAAVDEFYQEMK